MGGPLLFKDSPCVGVSYRATVESDEPKEEEEEEEVLDCEEEVVELLGKDGKSGARWSGLCEAILVVRMVPS